jgi:ribonuclease BN (tRNA processing enzyme)
MKIIENIVPLSLKNDGKLEIIFIGVGNAFAQKLHNNNFIIVKGDKHILVDFGLRGPAGLNLNTGLNNYDIETILPTHSHSDHIGALELLTLTNRYIGRNVFHKNKLQMIITDEYKNQLWEQSLRGGLACNEINEFNEYLTFDDYYEVISPKKVDSNSRTKYEIDFGTINLKFFRTNHVPDIALVPEQAFISYGLMIDDKILFSGDTKFDKGLIDEYGEKSEIIFHDCSFTPNPVHSSIDELKKLPSNIREKMLLMHYSDDYQDKDVSDFKGLAIEGVRYIFE